MSDYSFLKWPFFEDEHRTLVVELEKWAKSELIEYSSPTKVDTACRELVVKLAEAGWLDYSVTKNYGGKYSSLDGSLIGKERSTGDKLRRELLRPLYRAKLNIYSRIKKTK